MYGNTLVMRSKAWSHTYIHAYMHTCIHAYMHTCTLNSLVMYGNTLVMRSKAWLDGWFVKVDNRFGYEKWLQGGSIGLALL